MAKRFEVYLVGYSLAPGAVGTCLTAPFVLSRHNSAREAYRHVVRVLRGVADRSARDLLAQLQLHHPEGVALAYLVMDWNRCKPLSAAEVRSC